MFICSLEIKSKIINDMKKIQSSNTLIPDSCILITIVVYYLLANIHNIFGSLGGILIVGGTKTDLVISIQQRL